MAPDFEIFQKVKIMYMISFFQADLRLSARLNSRIEDCRGGGMRDDPYAEIEDVHSSQIEDCDPQAHGFVDFY